MKSTNKDHLTFECLTSIVYMGTIYSHVKYIYYIEIQFYMNNFGIIYYRGLLRYNTISNTKCRNTFQNA